MSRPIYASKFEKKCPRCSSAVVFKTMTRLYSTGVWAFFYCHICEFRWRVRKD
jgi:DNA-directed RNA polymerase subunit M/transcription elongation factor TFIIS